MKPQAVLHPCAAAHPDLCSSWTLKQSRDVAEKKGKCNIFFPRPLLLLGTFSWVSFAMTTASWMSLNKHQKALTAEGMQVFDFSSLS